ncbi:MAG: hypothetical protein ACTHKB_11550 [Burkholderiaceae bacterium]
MNAQPNIIAETIYRQLGGNKFFAMTGAKDFLSGSNWLQFRLPRAAQRGINVVRIILQDTDTYMVDFMKTDRYGLNIRMVKHERDIYADQLRAAFEAETGLATRL